MTWDEVRYVIRANRRTHCLHRPRTFNGGGNILIGRHFPDGNSQQRLPNFQLEVCPLYKYMELFAFHSVWVEDLVNEHERQFLILMEGRIVPVTFHRFNLRSWIFICLQE